MTNTELLRATHNVDLIQYHCESCGWTGNESEIAFDYDFFTDGSHREYKPCPDCGMDNLEWIGE